MTKDDIKNILLINKDILRKHKVNKIGIFGSYVSGRVKKRSDVDLIVDFEEIIDIFEFVNLIYEIQEVLKIKVDLVTPDAIKSYIRPKIMKEVEWIEGL